LWQRAKVVAARCRRLAVPASGGGELRREREEAASLLGETLDVAHDLGQWREETGERGAASEELFSRLTGLAADLMILKELLEKADARTSSLERARETALDAIRILLYNLAENMPRGEARPVEGRGVLRRSGDPLGVAIDFMRAVIEGSEGALRLPAKLDRFDTSGAVRGALAGLGQEQVEVGLAHARAVGQLRSVVASAARVDAAADGFGREVVERVVDGDAVTILLVALAGLAALLGVVVVTKRRRPVRESVVTQAAVTIENVQSREKQTTR
jgi:hypothetical protein